MVTLAAYIVMDLLKGAPVYEAMPEKMLPENQVTMEKLPIEIPSFW